MDNSDSIASGGNNFSPDRYEAKTDANASQSGWKADVEKQVVAEEKEKKRKKRAIEEEKERQQKAAENKRKLQEFFKNKKNVVILVVAVVIIVAAIVAAVILIGKNNEKNKTDMNSNSSVQNETDGESVKFYDNLTGEVASYSGVQYNADGAERTDSNGSRIYYSERQASEQAAQINNSRISCIQIPNGTDARPQVGLKSAKIVYEAIAEGGITRFAAIFRNANDDVIGPIRSLRTYFLEWDTPYDCTVVHAGGEENALKRVESYVHLSESAYFMWRDYSSYVAPNNLFTSGSMLNDFNSSSSGQTTSTPKVFDRLTPDESDAELKKIRSDADSATEKKYVHAENIYVHHTNGSNNYNVNYTYDKSTNTYLRSYEGNSGAAMTYTCKNTNKSKDSINPQKDCGKPTQVAPKVVIVIKVPEQLNQTNHYREDITTSGTGEATIFQNGEAIVGTWEKKSTNDQLAFKDASGNIIKLAPGQTWIHAVAQSYGYVKY